MKVGNIVQSAVATACDRSEKEKLEEESDDVYFGPETFAINFESSVRFLVRGLVKADAFDAGHGLSELDEEEVVANLTAGDPVDLPNGGQAEAGQLEYKCQVIFRTVSVTRYQAYIAVTGTPKGKGDEEAPTKRCQLYSGPLLSSQACVYSSEDSSEQETAFLKALKDFGKMLPVVNWFI
ncbi:unnamed protein product [Cyprideis torosa]|uniref:Uncharacterized protein n=1 Tax=Cyprideis torosa TaxID=163714 RepID=A0A7R8ZR88_9CRUS|nr:unnamed protein product [Cyprideis torosa]CAG0892431.1 unnamed protein product [Cyprideis torosa]